MKKNLLLFFVGLLGLVHVAEASCPLRNTFSYKQSDGTYIKVQKQGNGNFMFYTTSDGVALLRGNNGDFHYARIASDGLKSTEFRAHNVEMRTHEEMALVTSEGISLDAAYEWMNSLYGRSIRMNRGMENGSIDGLGELGKSGCGVVKSIGAPIIPVIMIEFPDCQFMEGTTKEKVSRMLNESGYADEKFCKGSVRDYFISQSNGLFSPTYEVVAKVKASQSYAFYGENYSNGAIDKNVKNLIAEALDLAREQGVDFSKFAKDEGRVPLVSVYFAGPGEHSSFEDGCENYIWAHFSETNYKVGEININSYFVGNEVLQEYKADESGNPVVTKKKFDGIGIFVHEFGHALGLPDFYKTSRSSEDFDTPDYWSVMDYGQYFYDGYAPIGYTAFERNSLGWVDIHELSSAGYLELYPFGEENKGITAYCIKNDANPKEYFILENRQSNTWYPKLMGHGMLITHIDYDASHWASNSVNNEMNRQRFEVIPADNVKSGYKDGSRRKVVWDYFKADLYPGLNDNHEFTDETIPASKVYTGTSLDKPIYNIKEENGVVYFSFMDKNFTGVEDVQLNNSGQFVDIYTVEGRRLESNKILSRGVYLIRRGNTIQKILVK